MGGNLFNQIKRAIYNMEENAKEGKGELGQELEMQDTARPNSVKWVESI